MPEGEVPDAETEGGEDGPVCEAIVDVGEHVEGFGEWGRYSGHAAPVHREKRSK